MNIFSRQLKNTPHCRDSGGFSLIETIVAITILLITVSGIMNLIYQGATASQVQQDRVIATYLAGDAIEYLRYLRDTYWLKDVGDHEFSGWVSSSPINECTGGDAPCRIDTRLGIASSTAITSCGGEQCQPLDYNSQNDTYGHASGGDWQESRFTREVSITTEDHDGGGADEAIITVTVSWERSGGETASVTHQESLFGWWR